MADRSNVSGGGSGSCLGIVAVALVSTVVILASYYHLHRRLDSDLRLSTNEQPRQGRTKKKKKVRFADDLEPPVDTSLISEEYRRWCQATAVSGCRLIRPALRKS